MSCLAHRARRFHLIAKRTTMQFTGKRGRPLLLCLDQQSLMRHFDIDFSLCMERHGRVPPTDCVLLTAFVTNKNHDDALMTLDEVIKGTASPPLIFANRTLHTRPSSLAA